jgi:hypothetical protein
MVIIEPNILFYFLNLIAMKKLFTCMIALAFSAIGFSQEAVRPVPNVLIEVPAPKDFKSMPLQMRIDLYMIEYRKRTKDQSLIVRIPDEVINGTKNLDEIFVGGPTKENVKLEN